MRVQRNTASLGFSLILCLFLVPCFGQMGISYQFAKPKEYENRELASEKSTDKKIPGFRRFTQNTVTHYNWYFNANNKLNEIIDRAKQAYRDDYSQLLSFYNYSLETTAADSTQLDSVSYKTQTGIAIHDLRNDWIDNMYLLWGATYYLKQQHDSAYLMFQFINYAFAPREKDGYYKTIGSRIDGNAANSIATKEKRNVLKKVFSEPPSRNDAFIWQIRNHLMMDQFAEASSLIVVLRDDPQFPARLRSDLEEVQAFMFYKQNNWDSAAVHLVQALDNATNRQERARWEYLAGQLFEMSNNYADAEKYYGKAISHANDPILEIYARLSSIRVNKDGGENYIEKNISTLLKMARRDKYADYRDIIYYMAAQMELERDNTDAALALLLKSTRYASNNASQRNRAFLQLAELSFRKRVYRDAHRFYDSLNMSDPALKDPDLITARKTILGKIVTNLDIIERQDSLQHIAALPEDERKELVRKLARQLRKAQGLKDEGTITTGIPLPGNNQAPPLFGGNTQKGDWYFYNSTLRQKGENDFRARWGKRPNVDNWRRSAALMNQIQNNNNLLAPDPSNPNQNLSTGGGESTYDVLYNRLPLTPESLQKSNDSLQTAQYELGKIYIQDLEDCPAGTETLEAVRTRFPQHPQMEDILFNLYYCYQRNGEMAKATAVKNQLSQQFPTSNLTAIVTTGKNPKDQKSNTAATRTYEEIYDLFIEGQFQEAVARKKTADSIYGNSYWTPQLLYIEAVYYIRQREDSVAKGVLNNIISRFDQTPMAAKATNLLNVLNRRAEIEEELRNLVIERPAEDTNTVVTTQPVAVVPKPKPPVVKDTVAAKPPVAVTPPPPAKDTVVAKPPVIKDTVAAKPPVVVPPVKDTVVTKPVDSLITKVPTVPARDTVAITPVPKDTVVAKPPVTAPAKPRPDTVVKAPAPKPAAPPVDPNAFNYNADVPHYVVVVLNKVDPVFIREAQNAFNLHNQQNYRSKTITSELVTIDADNRLLLMSPFKNAEEALEYVSVNQPKTSTQIVPWLKGGKYSFLIISQANLELLKTNKELGKYQQFLQNKLPGKF
jgi:tetratricopeptide (TPR) repeat protein